MDFEFVIPLSIDALQESNSSKQYAVSNVSTIKEIPLRIQGIVFNLFFKSIIIYHFFLFRMSIVI